MTGPDRGTPNPAGTVGSVAFFLAAVAVSLWVFAANGGLLTYFDSAYYIERGGQLVEMIGLADKAPPRPAAAAESTGTAGTAEPAGAGGTASGKAAAGAPKAGGEPESVDGSRSMVYSLVTGLFVWAGSVEGIRHGQDRRLALAITALTQGHGTPAHARSALEQGRIGVRNRHH